MINTAIETERAQRSLARTKVMATIGRETAIKRLTAISVLASEVSSNHSLIPKFLIASEDIDMLWESFLSYNRELLDVLFDLNQLNEFSTDLEGEVRVTYMSTREVVLQHRPMDRVNKNSNSAVNDSASSTMANRESRLPDIPLPTFSGNLLEWPVFRDRFDALIGQRIGLSNIERFYYLLGCLKDEALHTIANIPVSEANYALAWSSLVERFNKPRQLAINIVDNLLAGPVYTQESLDGLKEFLALFAANVSMLKSLNIPDLADFLLFALSSRCLSLTTRRMFEFGFIGDYPRVDDLMKFVKVRVSAFEIAGASGHCLPNAGHHSKSVPYTSTKPERKARSILLSTNPTSNPSNTCVFCQGNHTNEKCPTFAALSATERRQLAQEKRTCFRCLGSSHWANKCIRSNPCDQCDRHHHSLLHSSFTSSTEFPATTASATLVGHSDQPTVLLGTALIHVRDSSGVMQSVRALIDSASQISVISSVCVERLGLRITKWTIPLTGLAGVQVPKVNGVVDCYVSPRYSPEHSLRTRAWVLPRVTGTMPAQQLPEYFKEKFNHLALADPNFDCPSPVDMLLGADVFSHVFDGKRVVVEESLPAAFSSLFGWVIIGPVSDSVTHMKLTDSVSLMTSLENAVERFWLIEEPEAAPVTFTDNGKCEQIYTSERTRDVSGRFVVPLPFRGPVSEEQFPGARQMALRRFENLERKLKLDPVLRSAYTDFMNEYIQLGHMSVALKEGLYYLPHHAVFKVAPSNKIRVVFDASAQVTSGRSLNSQLLIGPKLQQDIVDVLLRFRVHEFVFTADVCKMYRQIVMQQQYKKFQHILWRPDPLQELKEFELNTVTYGVNCAPYLALRVLNDIAQSDCEVYPAVREVLQSQTYIDDICAGADTSTDVLQLQCDLRHVLKGAGLELKKWTSNLESVLLAVPQDDRALDLLQFDQVDMGLTKVLGIQWQALSDIFCYNIQVPEPVMTKRGVLSVIARIFDPLGLLAPCVFYAKHIMQLVWRADLNWDCALSTELANQWKGFIDELSSLSTVSIPRYFGTQFKSPVVLCGFCDASERGYAATVYVRFTAMDGTTIVSLVGTKTKMAPMKTTTMPRLELCAAVLLAKWMSRVNCTLLNKLSIEQVYAWSDSQVVLSWLTCRHTSFKLFVSNRVHQVQQLLPGCSWNYVRSAQNPADCASRGVSPRELSSLSLYWSGPEFLRQALDQWATPWTTIPTDQLPEVTIASLATTSVPDECEWFSRFSSYSNLIRVVVRMRRFIARCRRQQVYSSVLSSSEIHDAMLVIVKSSQSIMFMDLRLSLSRGSSISRSLAQLRPFVDDQGVIRIGGRLQNSSLSENQKHPILLAKSSHLALLIVRYWHAVTCHAGSRLMTSMIMRTFWILSVRVVVRKVRSQCVVCVRLSAQSPAPVMAALPDIRVQSCRPFSRVGIDFAGPLLVRECKLRKARPYKVYISVFVCMSVKAVHLEMVTDLSTAAFLAAFDRFVARRGLPQDIYSDCGTNFVGAAQEIRSLFMDAKFQEHIINKSVCTWHFNPPSAPHFGGIWEAAVKSMKLLLVRTMRNHNPTFEELSSMLCRIEAVLNSRPLTPMTSSPQDLDYLTPGHFLIGQPLLAVPEHPIPEEQHVVNRWKLLSQCHQSFWRRWSAEYLSSLQTRTKWCIDRPNINVGDMVVVKDAQYPPLKWRLGRITRVIPGDDGVVRVAHVYTQSGEISRPVVKLVLLPTT